MRSFLFVFLSIFFTASCFAEYSEVLDSSKYEIYVQDHKTTQQSLVTVSDSGQSASRYTFLKNAEKVSRPNYQMLDPNLKSGDIPYDGPVSNRKKVYYFAAGMAASGVLAGTLLPVSATATGSGAGAGAFAAGGAAVAAGSVALSSWGTKSGEGEDDFSHTHEAVLKRLRNNVS